VATQSNPCVDIVTAFFRGLLFSKQSVYMAIALILQALELAGWFCAGVSAKGSNGSWV